MRVCLMIEGQEGVTWQQWLALARAAEDAGLDALFRSDHYLSIVRGSPEAGALDAWTTLAGLAAVTTRLRLGTMVSPTTFRPAAVLAKSVVTVDHISGGRAELGIGAGWYEAEHEAYGFPFPPLRERMDELDRQLETIVHQWTADETSWPKPVQQPRPTVIVGGGAKPRTVRAAVRWADEYNTPFPTPEEARERRAIVDREADEAGRERLRFSMMTGCVLGADERDYERRRASFRGLTGNDVAPHMITGTVEQAAERLSEYDLDRAMLQLLAHEDVEQVALLGELQRTVA